MRVEAVTALAGTIDSVTIPAAGTPVVRFTVKDNFGRGAVGLKAATSGGTLRFNLVKLVADTAPTGASHWVPYINRSAAYDGGTDIQPTSERSGGTLVDFGDGTYEYTMALNVNSVTTPVAVSYDAALKHRFGIQVSGRPAGGVASLPPLNLWRDFVPNGGTVALARDVADEKSCNGCHGNLAVHGGSRTDVQYCVTCHTQGATLRGVSIEMETMTHKIHMGHNLPSVQAGGSYVLGNADFSHVGLPQAANNCRTCHNGETGAANLTPQGNNWRLMPTMSACGACHDNVNFATGANHVAGAQTSDAMCAQCHTEASIEARHAATTRSRNNPTGRRLATDGGVLSEFQFEIASVTADSTNHPVVNFRIRLDGANMNLGLDGGSLPSGISGGPSFLLAYALPQDGIATPADYNNLGRAAAQPLSVSLANLRSGSAGTLAGPDSNGFYTATLTGTNAWPTGATMRAVALQGYFSQNIAPTGTLSRPAPSVVKEVTGDAKRRVTVDNARCLTCHEVLSLHGGNRTNETGVCVTCHNPNLSSSGRGVDATAFMNQVNSTVTPLPAAAAASRETYLMFAPGASGPPYAPMDPLTWPEESNNFKDMIHGIHASHIRSEPFVFVRDRTTSGVFGYDWSHVTYPQVQGNCRACHTNTGYGVTLAANVLPSTRRTTTGAGENTAGVASARTNVPNATDHVVSPTAASCSGCHDGFLAKAHMMQNGGYLVGERANLDPATTVETCAICHGPGKAADIEATHPIIR